MWWIGERSPVDVASRPGTARPGRRGSGDSNLWVSVARASQVGDAVVAGAGGERVVERAARTSVVNPPALPPRMASRSGSTIALGRPGARPAATQSSTSTIAPRAVEQPAVGAAVAGAAAVVDVDDGEAPAGPELDAEVEHRPGRRGGTAVAQHERAAAARPGARRPRGWSAGRAARGRCARPPVGNVDRLGSREPRGSSPRSRPGRSRSAWRRAPVGLVTVEPPRRGSKSASVQSGAASGSARRRRPARRRRRSRHRPAPPGRPR